MIRVVTCIRAVKPKKERKLCCSVSTANTLSLLNTSASSFNLDSVSTQTYESFISNTTFPSIINSNSSCGFFNKAVIFDWYGCKLEEFSAKYLARVLDKNLRPNLKNREKQSLKLKSMYRHWRDWGWGAWMESMSYRPIRAWNSAGVLVLFSGSS